MEWKRRVLILGIVAGVYAGYRWFLPAVLPFLAAWILAVWLYPAAARIEKSIKIKKTIVGAFFLVLLFVGIGILLYLGTAELFSQVKTAVSNLPSLQRFAGTMLDQCCSFLEGIIGVQAADSKDFLEEGFSKMQGQIFSKMVPGAILTVTGCAKNLLFILSGLVVTFICTVLIIGEMEQLRKKIWDYSWLVGTRRVIRRLKKTTVTYLKAQILIMIAVSALCTAGLWLMKSPYFLLLGLGLGFFDMFPIIGTGTFLYPAALIFLLRGQPKIALGCVLLDLATSFLREFMEPRLLGDKLGISPIAILASVYIGVFVYGVWGVFLGPLSFSTIYEIGKQWDVWD